MLLQDKHFEHSQISESLLYFSTARAVSLLLGTVPTHLLVFPNFAFMCLYSIASLLPLAASVASAI